MGTDTTQHTQEQGWKSAGTFPAQRTSEPARSGVPQALSRESLFFPQRHVSHYKFFVLIRSRNIDNHLGRIQPNCRVWTKVQICVFYHKMIHRVSLGTSNLPKASAYVGYHVHQNQSPQLPCLGNLDGRPPRATARCSSGLSCNSECLSRSETEFQSYWIKAIHSSHNTVYQQWLPKLGPRHASQGCDPWLCFTLRYPVWHPSVPTDEALLRSHSAVFQSTP